MLPYLRRGIFEPLFARKTGSPKLRYWRELEATQYRTEEEHREIQWKRLKLMLQYSYENNRFYRKRFDEAGLQPRSIETPEDMMRFPVLTKKEIRENMSRMISDGFRKEDLLKFKTGGSTGKPLELYATEECSELRNACARRHDRWSGWEVGEPVGAVWGNPELPVSLREKLRNYLLAPTIYLDTMAVNDESVKEFARAWKSAKPTLLFGHAHSLFLLARSAYRLGIDTIRPKGIISTSMMLLPHERTVIERTFATKVFDRYGCEEVSLIGSECEKHEGMHLNIEHLFIEFIKDDGACAAEGEYGQIVVTDLMNRAMPFIRYRVEDTGVPSSRKCSCGRGLPLMEKVTGRVADFLVKPDGTRVAGISLIENTLTKIPGIEQMQIVQESLAHICLNVVPNEQFGQERERALVGYFEELFGQGTLVELKIAGGIKPEPSGKYRFSICRIDPQSMTNVKN
jgi:phenylacetate-CoA ligase